MPVHCVLIKTSAEPAVEGAMSREEREALLVALLEPVMGDGNEIATLVSPEPGSDAVPYISAKYRFSFDLSVGTLLEAIAEVLDDRAWWVIEYHSCGNGDGVPCPPFERVISFGEAPSSVQVG